MDEVAARPGGVAFGDPAGILVVDETGDVDMGERRVTPWQYTDTARQIEKAQSRCI